MAIIFDPWILLVLMENLAPDCLVIAWRSESRRIIFAGIAILFCRLTAFCAIPFTRIAVKKKGKIILRTTIATYKYSFMFNAVLNVQCHCQHVKNIFNRFIIK